MDKRELVRLAMEAKDSEPWWSRTSEGLAIAHIAVKDKLLCRPNRPGGIRTELAGTAIRPCEECMAKLKKVNLKGWHRMCKESVGAIEPLSEPYRGPRFRGRPVKG